jgi:hypothetical protein
VPSPLAEVDLGADGEIGTAVAVEVERRQSRAPPRQPDRRRQRDVARQLGEDSVVHKVDGAVAGQVGRAYEIVVGVPWEETGSSYPASRASKTSTVRSPR